MTDGGEPQTQDAPYEPVPGIAEGGTADPRAQELSAELSTRESALEHTERRLPGQYPAGQSLARAMSIVRSLIDAPDPRRINEGLGRPRGLFDVEPNPMVRMAARDRINKAIQTLLDVDGSETTEAFEAAETGLKLVIDSIDALTADATPGAAPDERDRFLASRRAEAASELRVLALIRRAAEAADSAESKAGDAKKAADNAEVASGDAGAAELSREFHQLAENEKADADLFRLLTIGLLGLVLGYAVWLAFWSDAEDYALLRRIVVSLAVLALAGYLGAQASQHRREARWAAAITVQLKTINAFTDALAPDRRDDLRYQFGLRVFTRSAELERSAADAPSPAEFESLAQRLIDVVNLAGRRPPA